jgi:hypothetical protein
MEAISITQVWIPHYLPRLTIPAEQGLWCPEDHD